MTVTQPMLAQTTWSDIGIPLVFITLVGVLLIVFVWQVFATSRAKSSVAREEAYRALAAYPPRRSSEPSPLWRS